MLIWTFSGNSVQYEHAFFSDEACRVQDYVIKANLDFVLPDGDFQLEVPNNINYRINSLTAMTSNLDTQILFNDFSGCGISDWTVGVPENILGLDCLGWFGFNPPPADANLYSIVGIFEGDFFVGQETSGEQLIGALDESNRPVGTDERTYTKTNLPLNLNLNGTWSMGCNDEGGNFSLLSWTFSGSTAQINYSLSLNSDCSDPFQQVVGQFNAVSQTGKVDGYTFARKFQFNIQSVLFTPNTSSAATDLNDDVACGFADWQSGVSKQLVGVDCTNLLDVNFPSAGTTYYNIIQVMGDVLTFGRHSEGPFGVLLEENRPLGLNQVGIEDFVKQ